MGGEENPVKRIKKFKFIRVLAILVPIIGGIIGVRVGAWAGLVQGEVICLSSFATSIVLCIYYLANLKKTDGKIWAVSICVWLVIMAVLSVLDYMFGG